MTERQRFRKDNEDSTVKMDEGPGNLKEDKIRSDKVVSR